MNIRSDVPADLSVVRTRQRQSWATGDTPVVVRPLVIVAENLCEAVELHPNQKVLDIGTATGNTAMAAARRYCEVTGVDYVAALLKVAEERASVERLPITFLEADAEQLPFSDSAFDAVLSVFGVMFAPNQEQAASELLRVCRSGGKIGLANWTTDGFFGKMGQIMRTYIPASPGLKSPGLWGTEKRLRELFGEEVVAFQARKQSFLHRYRSIQHAVEVTCKDLGSVVMALEALDPISRKGLIQDVQSIFEQANQASDGSVIVAAEYLEVVAVRR
jgi:SAM-dependent methyltransferase